MKKVVFILIPVYNDASSLEILLPNLEKLIEKNENLRFSICIVNDGS
jgi:hypothetical protein